ncbi:MAG: hypothetical protein WC107_05945 [Patescibacteria group bacterium]
MGTQVVIPALQFPPALPVNLSEVLEAQARCLIAYGIHGEVGVEEAKFLDDAMNLVQQFGYSVELAGIGLNEVWLVHYGVRDRFLCEAGGVNIWADPDTFTLFEGVTTPEGLCIVQGQLGQKYKGRAPKDIRASHDPLEQLGIPKDGLTAFLYWGKPQLQKSYMDFPGAVTEYGNVPYLRLGDGDPELDDDNPVYANPGYGSVSVSRGSQLPWGS